MFALNDNNRMLGFESLRSYPDIFSFVTTRHGGVSTGSYTSFNCSPFSGDDADSVRRNQELLLADMPPATLVIPHQTHGVEVAVIDNEYISASVDERKAMLEGIDALVTDIKGACLCISTADCVPILFYDTRLRVVGAAHAGWRGTLAGIATRTLQRMSSTYGSRAEDVVACIGPSISCLSFEIGDEVWEAFRDAGFNMERISIFNTASKKHHIDLWEANRLLLLEAGVGEKCIEVSGICTYLNNEKFFSARRLGIASGRILSGIMIK